MEKKVTNIDADSWSRELSGSVIDSIVIGSTANSILSKHGILPSKWEIPEHCKVTICQSNVFLTVVCWPASQACFRMPEISGATSLKIIFIDRSVLDCVFIKLTKREKIALILHEIGHVLYPVSVTNKEIKAGVDLAEWLIDHKNADKCAQPEISADKFANDCGYGQEIVSSLQTLMKFMPSLFDPRQVDMRIKAIQDQHAQ